MSWPYAYAVCPITLFLWSFKIHLTKHLRQSIAQFAMDAFGAIVGRQANVVEFGDGVPAKAVVFVTMLRNESGDNEATSVAVVFSLSGGMSKNGQLYGEVRRAVKGGVIDKIVVLGCAVLVSAVLVDVIPTNDVSVEMAATRYAYGAFERFEAEPAGS
ncbi:MAG: hypothetical protein LBI39_03370 [Puniceicoccales bacterium]|jgi:hypothetical protein|nr:hypothetical protein [Puniceicoccales bacterium]